MLYSQMINSDDCEYVCVYIQMYNYTYIMCISVNVEQTCLLSESCCQSVCCQSACCQKVVVRVFVVRVFAFAVWSVRYVLYECTDSPRQLGHLATGAISLTYIRT